jgi:hypothetical protein
MDPNDSQPEQTPTKGYGKRPLWQWILLYLIVGGLLYGLVYYAFLRGNSGY